MIHAFRPLTVRLIEYFAIGSVVLWALSMVWSDMGGNYVSELLYVVTAALGLMIILAVLCATRLKSDVALGMTIPFILVLLLVAYKTPFWPRGTFF
jgi:cell division protein FtsW (lipid II flippase)